MGYKIFIAIGIMTIILLLELLFVYCSGSLYNTKTDEIMDAMWVIKEFCESSKTCDECPKYNERCKECEFKRPPYKWELHVRERE